MRTSSKCGPPANFAFDLFPPALKGRLSAAQQVVGAAFQFATLFCFPIEVDRAGMALAFGVHLAFCAGGLALVAVAMVETRGREPAENRRALCETPFARGLARLSGSRRQFVPFGDDLASGSDGETPG